MSPVEAIAALSADPEAFLRTNRLKIFGGGPSSTAGAAIFSMEVNPKGGFSAKYKSQGAAAAPASPEEFRAWYIPMQQLSGFAANWLPKPADSPIRLMLTSQITGCLFGVGTNGGDTCVAHIQPDQSAHKSGGLSPKQSASLRQSDLRMNARAKGLTTFVAEGASYDMEQLEAVTVAGIRDDAGTWKFFAQNFNQYTNAINGITKM